MVLFTMSNAFVAKKKCLEFFYYVTQILRKKFVIVCVGDDYKWRNTNVGMQVSTDVSNG